MRLIIPIMICQALPSATETEVKRIWREGGMKSKREVDMDEDGGGGGDKAKRRQSDRRRMWRLMGCQLTVRTAFPPRSRAAKAGWRCGVPVCLYLPVRASRALLCSSLESLYFPSPRGAAGVERAHKWGYLSTLYNGVRSQRWEEKNKDEINHSSLVPPTPLIPLPPPSSSQLLQTFFN